MYYDSTLVGHWHSMDQPEITHPAMFCFFKFPASHQQYSDRSPGCQSLGRSKSKYCERRCSLNRVVDPSLYSLQLSQLSHDHATFSRRSGPLGWCWLGPLGSSAYLNLFFPILRFGTIWTMKLQWIHLWNHQQSGFGQNPMFFRVLKTRPSTHHPWILAKVSALDLKYLCCHARHVFFGGDYPQMDEVYYSLL